MIEAVTVRESENELVVQLRQTHVDLVNSIRRAIMNDVPTVAISTVHILTNRSVMADEFLGHRLGLVALQCPDEPYDQDKTWTLELEARGPCTVTAAALRHPALRPVDPATPLLLLGEDQGIRLRATARWGTGREHARFSPVCPVTYRYVAQIQVEDIEDWGALRKLCPRGVFRQGGAVLADRCNFCGECTRHGAATAARVSVQPQEGIFEMTVESTGALPPRKIVDCAIESLRRRMRQLGDRCAQSTAIGERCAAAAAGSAAARG